MQALFTYFIILVINVILSSTPKNHIHSRCHDYRSGHRSFAAPALKSTCRESKSGNCKHPNTQHIWVKWRFCLFCHKKRELK